MKNLKSLQVLALAGVAVTFLATGCSSTGSSRVDNGDQRAAYRFASSSGWVPITDARQLGKFPLEWNPVSHDSYEMAVPVAHSGEIAANTSAQSFDTSLQPGDTFVEAAGAGTDAPQVRRVIRYTPFANSSR